jgi:hypothetical protein
VREVATGAPPSLAEVQSWIGAQLDDAVGTPVGPVVGVYADAEDGAPVWLVVALPAGRRWLPTLRRRVRTAVVPARECAELAGRAWTAQRREAIRSAPAVDAGRPLLREHELTICLHYGIEEGGGRHAEVDGRAASSVTALPSFR